MALPSPLRESLSGGKFCYVVELVASRLKREALLLDVASQLARVPGVVAGSITSYAGGALGHDPIRVGTAARARGLTPNIHVTCASRDRTGLRKSLEDLNALGIENVFAITGDYPKTSDAASSPPIFDLDSVQLVRLIDEMRQAGMPFWIGVAVSPFKYMEADCAYQYLKLEKKFAAGANYAVTQLGYDVKKFRELKRYLDERGLRTPVLGNVYVLGAKAAERMTKGDPPGCWVAPELLQKIQSEITSPDKGQALRLERAARMVAILRGLGYAGAYIGGDHQADHVRWIMKRAEALSPRWEELADEFTYAPKGGFYLYTTPAAPPRKRTMVPRALDAMGQMFPVNREGKLRNLLVSMFRAIDKRPSAAHALERAEFAIKSPLFGCQACGNCVLGQMEYVCPQTCPKNLRNGPCGGTSNGKCEVVDKPCIWISVYDRAKSEDRVDELRTYIPPPNRTLKGTSSWINYFLNRDSRPGNPLQPTFAMASPNAPNKAVPIPETEVYASAPSESARSKTDVHNK
ncbi:MAG: methylenetetrahydrofolate reductase C-terminal domain-containing protein [Candidatus Acidiferrales bacterium]